MLTTVPSHQLADLLSSLVNSSYKEKLEILETLDLEDRFKKALPLVKRQTEGLKMIQNQRKQQITGKSRKLPARWNTKFKVLKIFPFMTEQNSKFFIENIIWYSILNTFTQWYQKPNTILHFSCFVFSTKQIAYWCTMDNINSYHKIWCTSYIDFL